MSLHGDSPSVRASVESYSLKKLEPFYGFQRDTSLPDAKLALTRLQTSLELSDANAIDEKDRETVQAYNREDCNSTHLHPSFMREIAPNAGLFGERAHCGDESRTGWRGAQSGEELL